MTSGARCGRREPAGRDRWPSQSIRIGLVITGFEPAGRAMQPRRRGAGDTRCVYAFAPQRSAPSLSTRHHAHAAVGDTRSKTSASINSRASARRSTVTAADRRLATPAQTRTRRSDVRSARPQRPRWPASPRARRGRDADREMQSAAAKMRPRSEHAGRSSSARGIPLPQAPAVPAGLWPSIQVRSRAVAVATTGRVETGKRRARSAARADAACALTLRALQARLRFALRRGRPASRASRYTRATRTYARAASHVEKAARTMSARPALSA